MRPFPKKTSHTLFFLAALELAAMMAIGCGKRASKDDLFASHTSGDTPAALVESAVASVNSALNDAEQVPKYAKKSRDRTFFISKAWAGACGVNRFKPALGSANCHGTANNATVTADFLGCTVGGESEETSLSGSVKLGFDAPMTCDTWVAGAVPTSGYVVRTTDALLRANPDGSHVIVNSSAHANYLGQSIGGGVRTSFTPTGRNIDILGMHRISTRGFDHSVYSTSSITATGLKANGSRKVTSGSVRIDHNRAKYSTTISLAGLSWNTSCCYPLSGSAHFALAGKDAAGRDITGDFTATFAPSNCGQISLSNKTAGTLSTIQLAACE